MNDEFGRVRATSLCEDLTLSTLDSRTGRQALDDGEDPRTVWQAICSQADVPAERWLGRSKPPSEQ